MSINDLPLLPGETILFRTRQHWTAHTRYFVFANVLLLLGGVLAVVMWSIDPVMRPFSPMWGVACIVAAPAVWYYGKVSLGFHEYFLTNQRLVIKEPLRVVDFYLENVQAVSASRSLFANYGWIYIVNAGAQVGFARVEHCQELARLIEQEIVKRKFPGLAAVAAAVVPPAS